jgi:hypothetical protein
MMVAPIGSICTSALHPLVKVASLTHHASLAPPAEVRIPKPFLEDTQPRCSNEGRRATHVKRSLRWSSHNTWTWDELFRIAKQYKNRASLTPGSVSPSV